MKRDGRAQWSRWDRPQQHGWLGSNGQIDAPAAQGGSPLCGMETIRLLQNITKLLGDTTDGMLYTPEDITVCTVENLNCFHTELQVIRWEHREHTKSLSLLIRNLSQMEQLKLKARTCKTDRPCHPCEGHQEQPVPQFLNKLLELLQRECWLQGSNVHSCSS
ncbi:interleukin-15-like isoform X4 [Pelodiscus sinensis]|uniref:interleukin-15-like isoform X4 n=1 Tax=Pelodiscus sinensis TaxID=13735 RepID=UPI003F6C1B97